MMVKSAFNTLRMKGEKACICSYEFYPETIQSLIESGKVFRFKYSKFWNNVPDMTLEFGGDSTFTYKLIVGGEFLIIRPIKK